MQATFRFYGPLNDFLVPERRGRACAMPFLLPASVKDLIESAGVPHPEVELIVVNGDGADFRCVVGDGDRIAVYPALARLELPAEIALRPALQDYRFVLDTHLGTLAGYLRMAGFDTLYRNDFADDTLARISSAQQRILLTRDRPLLKRGEVVYGYFVRATEPARQLVEVLRRYPLTARLSPFRRCLRCNGLLVDVAKDAVLARLPERTAALFHEYRQCPDCGRVYWKGSHFARMERFLAEAVKEAASVWRP